MKPATHSPRNAVALLARCGSIVRETSFSAVPTCPSCLAILARKATKPAHITTLLGCGAKRAA